MKMINYQEVQEYIMAWVKKDTMPAEAGIFIHRKPTFFKANSKAVKATGLDINTMR